MRQLLKLSIKCEVQSFVRFIFLNRISQTFLSRSFSWCLLVYKHLARTFVTYVSINMHQLFVGRITHLLFSSYLNWFQSAYT